jgi:hypothetical protein
MEIFLRKIPKLNSHVHMSPPLFPVLKQMNPVHIFHPIFLRSIIILFSHLRVGLTSSLFLSGSLTITLYTILIYSIRATFPPHFIFLDLITLIIVCEGNKLWSSSLCSVLQFPATFSLFYYIFSSAPCSQMLSIFRYNRIFYHNPKTSACHTW